MASIYGATGLLEGPLKVTGGISSSFPNIPFVSLCIDSMSLKWPNPRISQNLRFLQLENGVMSQAMETSKQNKVPKMGENSTQLLHVSSLEHSWEVGSLFAEPH